MRLEVRPEAVANWLWIAQLLLSHRESAAPSARK